MYTQGQAVPPSPSQARLSVGGLNAADPNLKAYASVQGGHHSYSREEVRAFGDYVNNLQALRQDPQLAGILPIPAGNEDAFFAAFEDGVLLCKLVNVVKPGTIDPKHITVAKNLAIYHKTQNLNTAIAASHELGIKLVNIGAEDVVKQVRHLVLSLVWQIVRHSLLSHVNLKEHPELVVMYEQREDVHSLLNQTPEEAILRWINYHLKFSRAGSPRVVRNFQGDIADGEAYMLLMSQIAPHIVPQQVRQEQDPRRRADLAVQFGKAMGVETFVTPNDILTGNKNLNLAFCADMFNKYPAIQVQNFDAMQQQTLRDAENKLRLATEQEERARRERWAWEDQQRKNQWQQEDQARQAQLAQEDQARNVQRQAWDEEARRREEERQRWMREEEERRMRSEEEEKRKEENLRYLEEQTRQLSLQTQQQQQQAAQLAAQQKSQMEAQQQESMRQQLLIQQQMEQQRAQQQQLQQQQQAMQTQQQQYQAMMTQPQAPVPPPQQQQYAMNPYATAQPMMAPPSPYMTQQQVPMGMAQPTVTTVQQYPPPMMYQQTVYQPPPPVYQTTTVYQPPPQVMQRTTVTTTRTVAPTPTVVYGAPSVTVIRHGKKW